MDNQGLKILALIKAFVETGGVKSPQTQVKLTRDIQKVFEQERK